MAVAGGGPTSGVAIDKVLKLFTGANSDKLYDRHMSALDRLCKSNASGFAIKDLPQIQKLFELSMGLIIEKDMTDFIQPTVALLKVLAKPFVKTTSTDEFRLVSNMTDVLSSVSRALLNPSAPQDIKIAISELLLVFASGHGTRPNALVALPTLQELSTGSPLRQYLFNTKLLVDSAVPQTLVQGLALACESRDELLLMSLALTLAQLSHHPDNVLPMLDSGVLCCLPHLLNRSYNYPMIPVSIEVLWNLLERAPQATRTTLAQPQPSLSQCIQGVTVTDLLANPPVSSESLEQTAASQEQGSTVASTEDTQPVTADTAQTDGAEAQAAPEAGDAPEQPAGDAPQAEQADQGLTSSSPRASSDGPGCVLPALASVLSELFKTILLQGYRALDKELRNDILVVINLIIGTDHIHLPQPGKHPVGTCGAIFSSSAAKYGLFESLLAVSACPEVSEVDHSSLVKPWALTTEEYDLEMKQLAWKACVAACVHVGPRGSILQQAKTWHLMRALLACVEMAPDPAAQPTVAAAAQVAQRRWIGDPATQLRLAALSRLHALAPLCPEVYLAEGGQHVVLRLLNLSSHSASLEASLRHLHHLVCCAPEMAEVVGEGGGMRTVLDLLQNPGHSQPTRHYCLLLLAALCRVNVDNLRRLRRESGVLALVGILGRCRQLDATLPNTFTVAVLDTIWMCVASDRKSTAKFLVEDGMDLLLDLLETSNKGHRGVILSLICDLLENQRSHPFFMNWKSSVNGQTGAQLLLSIWKDEEAARGMTQGGVLTNTQRPLQGTGTRTQWVPQEGIVYTRLAGTLAAGNTLSSSGQLTLGCSVNLGCSADLTSFHKTDKAAEVAAMLEASAGETVLAKIYGCFRLLGFNQFSTMSPADSATLALIEMFVKFKQGELWADMHAEFEATGIRPTTPDQERVESGIDLAENLGHTVQGTQALLLEKQLRAAQEQEAAFFENMRAQRKLEQEARFYTKDKSQLTLAELREAKQKKEAMLRSSIQHVRISMGGEQPLIGTAHA